MLAPTEIMFFARHEPAVVALAIFTLLCLAFFVVVAARSEPRTLAPALAVLPLLFVVAALDRLGRPEIGGANFMDSYHMTSFFTSLPEAFVYSRGALLPYTTRRMASSDPAVTASLSQLDNSGAADAMLNRARGLPAAQVVRRGEMAAPHPNSIVILHESMVAPGRFNSEPQHHVPAHLFTSSDGSRRKLIVETFGGGTWISEYGLHLGVSTHHFGDVRSYLGHALDGKVNHSLERYLRSLGYSSVALYSADRNFANTANFYKSLGFDDVFDPMDTGAAPSSRDKTLYEFLMRDLKNRRQKGDHRPMFYFVLTVATHFPYTYAAQPDARPDEIALGDEWAEYSRRVRISLDDLEEFKRALASQFPDEQFLLVGFGDHQPFLMRSFYPRKVRREQVGADELKASPHYDSFFRVEGVHFTPTLRAIPQEAEIGFLSTIIALAAGLPLDESFRSRSDLMKRCNGLLFRCSDQTAVTDFYGQLVERGDLPGIEVRHLGCAEAMARGLRCNDLH